MGLWGSLWAQGMQSTATDYEAAISADKPLVHLRFPHDPTAESGASAAESLGSALKLDGGRSAGAESQRGKTQRGKVQRDGDISVECWFLTNEPTGTLLAIKMRPADEQPDSGAGDAWNSLCLELQSNSTRQGQPPTASLCLTQPSGSEIAKRATLFPTIYPGKWYHLVVVLDHEVQVVRVYLNGVELERPASPFQPATEQVEVDVVLLPGDRFEGGNGFDGRLDEIALYGRPLSAEQVRRHFHAAIAPTGHLKSVRTVGHRGNKLHAPENTLASVNEAIEAGSSMVEIDLNISRDGEVVLMHDDTIDRTTNGAGKPEDHTAAELGRLDAGSWKHARYAGEKVPTLAETIELVDGRAVLMLDLKRSGLGRPLAKTIEETKLPLEQVVFGPWKDSDAADVLKHIPQATVVQIGSQPPAYDAAWFAEMRRKGYAGVSLDWRTVTHAFVRAAREHDFQVYTWTVNDPVDLSGALLMGVTGIITDDPAGLTRVRKSLR